MQHQLPTLPYALDALSPYISEETLSFHYGKHHKAYVDNLNKLIVDTDFADKSLEDIIKTAPRGGIFNNAAQIWNHTFYFLSLVPATSASIPAEVVDFITQKWESIEQFQEEFNKNALANFGSGWTWLVKNAEWKPEIINTDDAETPLINPSVTPLLTCDIWEHAYYIDYRNARANYLDNFWKVVNWSKVAERLG